MNQEAWPSLGNRSVGDSYATCNVSIKPRRAIHLANTYWSKLCAKPSLIPLLPPDTYLPVITVYNKGDSGSCEAQPETGILVLVFSGKRNEGIRIRQENNAKHVYGPSWSSTSA